jgi:hypothetical protein
MIGLTLQAAAVLIVHLAIRGRWSRHLGALFLAMAVLGHGLTEIVQQIWPGRNTVFRSLVSQHEIDNWVLLVSTAILLYATAYAAVIAVHRPVEAQPAGRYIAGLRLRVLLGLTAPLIVATMLGHGAQAPVAIGASTPTGDYFMSGLASLFLVPLMALTGVVVLVRYGTRWTLPVLGAQAALLAFAGTRSMIAIALVLSIFGARLCGARLPRGHLTAVVAVALLFTATISVSRATGGRDAFLADQGTSGRLTALTDGASHLGSPGAGDAILNDLVYRFDDNTYGALILDSLQHGYRPVGLATVRNDLLLGVPRFLQPGKLSTAVEDRNEEQYLDAHFGLDSNIDYLTGVLASIVGYYGPLGLLIAALLIGVAFALAEAMVAKAASPTRLVLAVGLAQCVLLYEGGPAVYITTLRGAVVLMAAVWAGRRVWRGTHRPRPVLTGRHRPATPTAWPPSGRAVA